MTTRIIRILARLHGRRHPFTRWMRDLGYVPCPWAVGGGQNNAGPNPK